MPSGGRTSVWRGTGVPRRTLAINPSPSGPRRPPRGRARSPTVRAGTSTSGPSPFSPPVLVAPVLPLEPCVEKGDYDDEGDPRPPVPGRREHAGGHAWPHQRWRLNARATDRWSPMSHECAGLVPCASAALPDDRDVDESVRHEEGRKQQLRHRLTPPDEPVAGQRQAHSPVHTGLGAVRRASSNLRPGARLARAIRASSSRSTSGPRWGTGRFLMRASTRPWSASGRPGTRRISRSVRLSAITSRADVHSAVLG